MSILLRVQSLLDVRDQVGRVLDADRKPDRGCFVHAAGAGELLNIHDLKTAYEKAIGHPTSDSTVYNLLHRHGWRKLMPRPFHPKRNLAAQDAFKKTVFMML